MANTRYARNVTDDWFADASWSTASGGAALSGGDAGTYPGFAANDIAIFDSNSSSATITVESGSPPANDLADVQLGDGTVQLNDNLTTEGFNITSGDIQGNSDLIFDGTSVIDFDSDESFIDHGGEIIVAGDATINSTAGALIGNFTLDNLGNTAAFVDNTGSLLLKNVLQTAGTLDWDSQATEVFGYADAGGTISNTGEVTSVGGSSGTPRDIYFRLDNPPTDFIVPSGSFARVVVGFAYCQKASIAGTLTANPADRRLNIIGGSANWFRDTTGTVSAILGVFATSNSPGGDITINNCDMIIESNVNRSMTIDGHVDLGTGDMVVSDSSANITITMADRKNITAATLRVGNGGGGLGDIDLNNGDHTLTGGGTVLFGQAPGAGDNAVDFGVCDINSFGKIDGTNIGTITNDGAAIHGGSIEALDLTATNELNAINGVTKVGVGNVNVVFEGDANEVNFPSVGTLSMLGAGV